MNSLSSPAFSAGPVAETERIILLDSLRGFAILGILLMNIPGFALPEPVIWDPTVLNEMGTANFKTWFFIEWFMEGSQRALFSMLFGAGILLFIQGKEKRLTGMEPADYFFRRQLWLLVFGIINGFLLLWFWDILFHYACCGMIIFAFRNLSAKRLLMAAFVCLLLMLARENWDFFQDKRVIRKGEAVAAMDTTNTKLTALQKQQLAAYTDMKEAAGKEAKLKRMEKSLTQVKGNYADFYFYQSNRTEHSVIAYLYYGLWDVLLFMFIGMAFFKMGILTGQAPAKTYWLLFAGGLGVGLILSYFRLQPLIIYQFNRFEITKNAPVEYYELSRTLRAIGIFGLIMLLYKSGVFKWLFSLMRPVGQMAFTNYLMQSIMCGLFFYGFGFNMFGKFQRYEMYYVVGTVWLIQIIYSHIWLRYFRFGPMEWLWRSLTYWKLQPLRK